MAIFAIRFIQSHSFDGVLLLSDLFLAGAREKEK
jgi:hypothetical protein